MANRLSGKDVVNRMKTELTEDVCQLKERGISPKLAILRVGAREDDLSYENGAIKRAESVGVAVERIVLPEDATQAQLMESIGRLNSDPSVHGVLLFRPLPKGLDDAAARAALDPAKDIDGITDPSMIGLYTGQSIGFPPCTPQACIEILDHYGIELEGKHVVVVGRSLVVGKPAALMLMQRNATVTVCHTRTKDMPALCRTADILIVSAGKAGVVDATYCSSGQIVLDVGINIDKTGRLCGDVRFEEVEPLVQAITPVPGGVGTVTTSVLLKHVIRAAKATVTEGVASPRDRA